MNDRLSLYSLPMPLASVDAPVLVLQAAVVRSADGRRSAAWTGVALAAAVFTLGGALTYSLWTSGIRPLAGAAPWITPAALGAGWLLWLLFALSVGSLPLWLHERRRASGPLGTLRDVRIAVSSAGLDIAGLGPLPWSGLLAVHTFDDERGEAQAVELRTREHGRLILQGDGPEFEAAEPLLEAIARHRGTAYGVCRVRAA
ncbi:hypothetical protein [Caldimonas brevitalea]|uniref:Uncharacterized protein n=1 Tax=Caldimonas brevitalea TaxID=413882 RepID=A0A0G3BBH9_9BURK|nr:hypothetical protein [Caldimonas brevitalea]AKJ26724.1 hypothetical protein AAW51_0033 [Caldimonas brevitalea]